MCFMLKKETFQQHYKLQPKGLYFLFIDIISPCCRRARCDNPSRLSHLQDVGRGLVRIQGWFSSSGTISYNLSQVLIGRSGALHINRKWFPPKRSACLLAEGVERSWWREVAWNEWKERGGRRREKWGGIIRMHFETRAVKQGRCCWDQDKGLKKGNNQLKKNQTRTKNIPWLF